MSRRVVARRAFALMLSACWATACASSAPRPGVGDISFRLAWEGEADLDLYVTSPFGERIDFLHREVPSGGRLDIDCNVTISEPAPVAAGQFTLVARKLRCPRPLENVFWPRGRAPAGEYHLQAVVADGEDAAASDRYRLEVRFGREVVVRAEGLVASLATAPLSRALAFPSR